MERIWSTTTSDGEVFKGTDINQVESEANAHELELSKKKQEAAVRQRKTEEERKARFEKAKAEAKVRDEKKKEILSQVANHTNKINELCNEYGNIANGYIYFWSANGKLMCDASDAKSCDLIGLLDKFFQ